MEEEQHYLAIGQKIIGAEQSQMFGKPCFKINGKAFISFFRNEMVFKLTGDIHQMALELEGSKLFDPSDKNRPMKEWVQIPFQHQNQWEKFAIAAVNYVGG